MALRVTIDPHSGFCGGVIRAIGLAEKFLREHPGETLYSLGAIVHNEEELARLTSQGMVTVDMDSLRSLAPEGAVPVLIRAHGEPPSTYAAARERSYALLDCTCPVVLKLQKDIRDAYARLTASPRGGQLVIFGRIGHAEVLGLVGQVDGDALVVESEEMLRSMLREGKLRCDAPVEVFSQTTKSPAEYARICTVLSQAMSDPSMLTVHNTICTQVALRNEHLSDFARTHDVVVFVAGESSSNGKVLYDLCKSFNDRTFMCNSAAALDASWFRKGDRVGVSGATSTPRWLLEQVSSAIAALDI